MQQIAHQNTVAALAKHTGKPCCDKHSESERKHGVSVVRAEANMQKKDW